MGRLARGPGAQPAGEADGQEGAGCARGAPAPSLPVTKVTMPFTKARDWQAAYSPSPCEGRGRAQVPSSRTPPTALPTRTPHPHGGGS